MRLASLSCRRLASRLCAAAAAASQADAPLLSRLAAPCAALAAQAPLPPQGSLRGFAAGTPLQPAVPMAATEGAPAAGETTPTVVFVLGGPGAGKGTQCANIVRDYGFVHLSAGDLLRAHMKSGSADGQMVAEMIANGQIVPSSVTVNLLRGAIAKAAAESGARKFLVDGFPRNAENRDAWEAQAGYDCAMVLFFDVPEAVMETRLLARQEGRTDDNAATIRKRFAVFQEQTQPVVAHYAAKGKVARVAGVGTPAEVYEATKPHFAAFK